MRLRALGLLPIGTQTIALNFIERPDGVRIVHDSGGHRSGALGAAPAFDHRMAIAPDPAGTGKTLYRDQLSIGSGLVSAAAWYPFWAFWQLRGARIRALAPSWHHIPDLGDAAEVSPPGDASAS